MSSFELEPPIDKTPDTVSAAEDTALLTTPAVASTAPDTTSPVVSMTLLTVSPATPTALLITPAANSPKRSPSEMMSLNC